MRYRRSAWRVPTREEQPRPQAFGLALAVFIALATIGAVFVVNVVAHYEVPQRLAAALNRGG